MGAESSEAKDLYQFIEIHANSLDKQKLLHSASNIDDLNKIIGGTSIPLTAAVIPLEQATRSPKILVDSGEMNEGIPWRILRCPGGPFVLQIICADANFALWFQEC